MHVCIYREREREFARDGQDLYVVRPHRSQNGYVLFNTCLSKLVIKFVKTL